MGGDEEGGVETETELTDEVAIGSFGGRGGFGLGEEVRGSGLGNRSKVSEGE